ncbi:MAG: hypothetical protein WB788_09010 [Thermoplasmata archaeon]
MVAEPPEVQSIKSMLHIVRILAIIFGILLFLAGVAYAAFLAYAFSVCGAYGGFCTGSLGFALIPAIFIIIFGVVDFVIYMQMKEIEAMVNNRQYEAAKSKTLLWMILGFILGGIIIGVLLLIAYLKFDPVITWSRNQQQGGMPPPGYAPQYAPPPPMAPPPPPAPAPVAAPATPMCAKCGRPTTYIAQYGRYYCYTDNLYV